MRILAASAVATIALVATAWILNEARRQRIEQEPDTEE